MTKLLKSWKLKIILFLFFVLQIRGQKIEYATLLIPESLKENANNIIRFQSIDVNIISQKALEIKTKKAITVFNYKGLSNIDAREYYSKSEKVNAIEAIVYNSFGKEIKKIKRSDFRDQSIADGFSILTDGRTLFLDYTPTEYPFTIVFESETKTSNTAFLPSWSPIDDYFESVEKSEISIHFPPDLGFKYKEINFDGRNILKNQQANTITFKVENLVAEKPEDYSPSSKILPLVKFGLEKFYLEGVEGNVKNWSEYGSWTYNNLLSDTEAISDETIIKIKTLVGTESDPIKKAKIVYQYVQDKTRYVSIQLGIGGWKPMLAKDVDRLGYGDCKALANYTRVLLKTVGVEAFYTEIYGDRSKKSFETDFVSMQGNHIILALPDKDKMIFLECTDQSSPFGFQGSFTDDRFALLVKPEKGEIIKTNEYSEKASTQIGKGSYEIDQDGNLSGSFTIKSKGIQYANKYVLESNSNESTEAYYKDYFSWVNNLKLEKVSFQNDKEMIEFTEDLKLYAQNYGTINGSSMVVAINAFDQNSNVPQRYRNRKNPLEIARGFYDESEIEVNLPQGFKLEAKPDNFEIKGKFGEYKMELLVGSNKIMFKRSLLINKGLYDKSEYENYRQFREQIAKADNSKIILTKNQ
jgi:hypothetical protein